MLLIFFLEYIVELEQMTELQHALHFNMLWIAYQELTRKASNV